jgi:hypothetical protein
MNISRRESVGLVAFVSSLTHILSDTTRDRSAPKEAPRNTKIKAAYCPLSEALLYKWTGLAKRQTKEVNPALFFSILGTIFYSSCEKYLTGFTSFMAIRVLAQGTVNGYPLGRRNPIPYHLLDFDGRC